MVLPDIRPQERKRPGGVEGVGDLLAIGIAARAEIPARRGYCTVTWTAVYSSVEAIDNVRAVDGGAL